MNRKSAADTGVIELQQAMSLADLRGTGGVKAGRCHETDARMDWVRVVAANVQVTAEEVEPEGTKQKLRADLDKHDSVLAGATRTTRS